ncbi:hypothetical protein VPH35_061872 [Triticum aestivum]|uniref:uncharacterized protein n=1 Tax=Triticum aestivum TaxID=4565 RepID=UPI000842AB97|nr:uncharacterized protein LOC123075089 [Triticum aestivum]
MIATRPGLVHAAGQDLNSMTVAQRYALMKANVDGLKPLQVVGLRPPRPQVAWEFNLADPHDQKALDYLANRGVDLDMLGALLMASGLIGAGHGQPAGLRRCHDGGRLPGHAGGAGPHRR